MTLFLSQKKDERGTGSQHLSKTNPLCYAVHILRNTNLGSQKKTYLQHFLKFATICVTISKNIENLRRWLFVLLFYSRFVPPALSSVDYHKNVSWLTGGSNWPPLVQKTLRDQQGDPTDLLWSKNVTWPTQGPNWPPLIQKCNVTNTGPQLTFWCSDIKQKVWSEI